MAAGDYPSVHAVRAELTRGSTTTIAESMRRFWKDQAALNAGDPVALTRLPPEFADAAVSLWEQALRLSLQTAQQEDNAARARLNELKRDTETRARSMELREKEWDMAARVRERALADARQQVNLLLNELAKTTAELRTNKVQIAELQAEMEDQREQTATMIARAVRRDRPPTRKPNPKAKRTKTKKKAVILKPSQNRRKR